MKKILISLLLVILNFAIVNANSVDFYWEKDSSWWLWNSEISVLQNKINTFQKNTGLNTDIVILWKLDSKWCYNIPNFDNCVQSKYWYWTDIIVVLKMKSDISSRWDMRSYMDNKNYPIITTSMLKNIQDSIVYNFKNNNFEKWLVEYYDKLNKKFINTCNNLLKENENLWWKLYKSKCNIPSLQKVLNENKILETNKQKNASFMRNIYIWISFILFIIFMIVMHYFYLWRLKKLFNDIKFQLIDLDKKKTFKQDYEKTKKDLEKLVKKIEIYLWNSDKIWTKLRKYYLEVNEKADEIKSEYNKSVENFNKQDELNKELQDFKNINI